MVSLRHIKLTWYTSMRQRGEVVMFGTFSVEKVVQSG